MFNLYRLLGKPLWIIPPRANSPWIIAPRTISPQESYYRTIVRQDDCPLDNWPPDNCPPDNCLKQNCHPDNWRLNNCSPDNYPLIITLQITALRRLLPVNFPKKIFQANYFIHFEQIWANIMFYMRTFLLCIYLILHTVYGNLTNYFYSLDIRTKFLCIDQRTKKCVYIFVIN